MANAHPVWSYLPGHQAVSEAAGIFNDGVLALRRGNGVAREHYSGIPCAHLLLHDYPHPHFSKPFAAGVEETAFGPKRSPHSGDRLLKPLKRPDAKHRVQLSGERRAIPVLTGRGTAHRKQLSPPDGLVGVSEPVPEF